MKPNSNPMNRRGSWIRRTCGGLLLIAVGGCAMIRHDSAPITRLPVSQISLAKDIKLSHDGWPQARWWRQYGDSQLNSIIERAVAQSPSMAVATARVEAARAQAKLAEADSGPLIGMMASIDRQSVSENGFLGPFGTTNPAFGTTGPWYTSGKIGLSGEYELDIWGKDKKRVDAALGVVNARQAEAAQTELMLSTQIAHVYFDIQSQHAAKRLLEQARDIEQEAVAAHQAKAETGLEPRTPGETARTHQLELDKQIAATQTHIQRLRESLRGLVGAGASDLPEISAKPLPVASGKLPSSLGYELLARRPDLQAMRWYVQSSFDQIDAAKAAFYPSFDIRAFAGFDALHLEDLLHRSSRQLNLVPGLTLPIFDSGRLNANLASTRSQSNLLITQYNQSIVNAVREVAQASIEVEGLQRQATLQDGKIQASNFAYNSADAHYHRGLTDKVSAMEAKLPVLQEQGKALTLQTGEIHAQVSLIAALGGGYRG